MSTQLQACNASAASSAADTQQNPSVKVNLAELKELSGDIQPTHLRNRGAE